MKPPMSDFELVDEGDGRFAVRGDMSFATANSLLRRSDKLFARHQSLAIDLSAVTKADSAGLALIIEWKSQAAGRQAEEEAAGSRAGARCRVCRGGLPFRRHFNRHCFPPH